MDVNPEKLNAFMGKMLGDMGAAANAARARCLGCPEVPGRAARPGGGRRRHRHR